MYNKYSMIIFGKFSSIVLELDYFFFISNVARYTVLENLPKFRYNYLSKHFL